VRRRGGSVNRPSDDRSADPSRLALVRNAAIHTYDAGRMTRRAVDRPSSGIVRMEGEPDSRVAPARSDENSQRHPNDREPERTHRAQPSVSRKSAPWCAMYESIPTSYSLNTGDSRRFTSSMQPKVRPWAMTGEQRMLRVS